MIQQQTSETETLSSVDVFDNLSVLITYDLINKSNAFVQAHNIHKVEFAMQALKHAMKWDEDTFGLEYDLDLFNIVAIDDFNMGETFVAVAATEYGRNSSQRRGAHFQSGGIQTLAYSANLCVEASKGMRKHMQQWGAQRASRPTICVNSSALSLFGRLLQTDV